MAIPPDAASFRRRLATEATDNRDSCFAQSHCGLHLIFPSCLSHACLNSSLGNHDLKIDFLAETAPVGIGFSL